MPANPSLLSEVMKAAKRLGGLIYLCEMCHNAKSGGRYIFPKGEGFCFVCPDCWPEAIENAIRWEADHA